jgi:WD40 repeat protein
VQNVKFSHRWPSVFLSCSADWSVRLYHMRSKAPLLSMRATGEDFPINDISWCPDNSTVFACVTVDAKLQVWDLSVSSIDPVVTVDCAADDDGDSVGDAEGSLDGDGLGDDDDDTEHDAPNPPMTAGGTGPLRTFERLDLNGGAGKDADEVMSPVSKLLKNLATDSRKKVLTSLQFGVKTPTIVVGDSQGTVSVYRVFDPVTITHLGPLQQANKLNKAVIQQTDPENVSLLQGYDMDETGLGGEKQNQIIQQ